MGEITRGANVRVGVDLAKRVIQVHAVDGAGGVVVAKALARDRFMSWCAQLPAGCVVAMETCGGAHHWARRLRALGLDARLIAGHFVGPYRMQGVRGKNDANDAAAICEAASRPSMRFVPVKTLDQQAMLAVHRLREGYKEERTACINRIRGLLSEFGAVVAQSPEALRLALPLLLEDAGTEMPLLARLAIQRAQLSWLEIECHIAWCDERIAAHVRCDERAHSAAQLCGVGPVTASALVSSVGDFTQFRSGAQFGAWLGLVPAQNSSGGKARLGGITKRGDDYLRTLLIQGAKSAVMTAHKRRDRISQWLVQLQARVGWQKGGGGAGKQECSHPVGGADTRRSLRREPRLAQAGRPVCAARRCSHSGRGRLNRAPSRHRQAIPIFPRKTCSRRCITQVRPAAGELDNPSVAASRRRHGERMESC